MAEGNLKWYSHYGKQSAVPWIIKCRVQTQSYNMTQRFHLYLFTQENWKPMSTQNLYTNAYSNIIIIAKRWKQPKCPSTDELVNKIWYIHTMEHYSAIKWMKLWYTHLTAASKTEQLPGFRVHCLDLLGRKQSTWLRLASLTNPWNVRHSTPFLCCLQSLNFSASHFKGQCFMSLRRPLDYPKGRKNHERRVGDLWGVADLLLVLSAAFAWVSQYQYPPYCKVSPHSSLYSLMAYASVICPCYSQCLAQSMCLIKHFKSNEWMNERISSQPGFMFHLNSPLTL